jgi:hypothetical protein
MVETVRRAAALVRTVRCTAMHGAGRIAGHRWTGGRGAAREAVCLFLIPSGFSRMRPSLAIGVFALTILASSANLVAPFLADQGPVFSLRKTLAGIAARPAAENETSEAPRRPADTPAPAWVAEHFAGSDRTDLALAAGSDAAPVPPEVPTDAPARSAGPEPVDAPEPQAAEHPFTGVWAANERACSPQLKRGGYLPTIINTEGAWAGETTCAFKSTKRDGSAFVVSAVCSDPYKSWRSLVRLTVHDGRLTWKSQSGSRTYVRCGQGQARTDIAQIVPIGR